MSITDKHGLMDLRASTKRYLTHNLKEIRESKRQKLELLEDHPKLMLELLAEPELRLQ